MNDNILNGYDLVIKHEIDTKVIEQKTEIHINHMCYRKRIKSSSSEIELNRVYKYALYHREHHPLAMYTQRQPQRIHRLSTFDPTERETKAKQKGKK